MFRRGRKPSGANGGGSSLPIVLDSHFDPKWVATGTAYRKNQVSSQKLPNPADIDRTIKNLASIPGVRDLNHPGYFRATAEMNSIGASLLIAGDTAKAGSSLYGAERRLAFVRQSYVSMQTFMDLPDSSGAAQLHRVQANGDYADTGKYILLAPSLRVFEAVVEYNLVCLILAALDLDQEASLRQVLEQDVRTKHQGTVDWLEQIPVRWRTAGWELVRTALSSVETAIYALPEPSRA